MARRGENIRKRKDGRWEGRYMTYDWKKGKNVSCSVYARTYGETKEKLSLKKSAARRKPCTAGEKEKIVFGAAALCWLSETEKKKKPASFRKYCSVYEKYLEAPLGMVSVSELSGQVFEEVLVEYQKDGLSESLLRSITSVLNQILAYSEAQYQTEHFRYSFKKESRESRPVEVLKQSEQIRMLEYLHQDMDICKLGIILCIFTGLRLGELCALKWEDIDLNGKILYVNSTVQRIAVEGHTTKTILMEGTPKSICSRREIPIADELITLLGPFYGTGVYVLNQQKPMEPRTYQNKFQTYLKQAGIERKNFHILRHTFATNCIASGMDVKSLSEVLGHADVKITLNRYVHPSMETKRRHVNSMSAVYGQYLGQRCS